MSRHSGSIARAELGKSRSSVGLRRGRGFGGGLPPHQQMRASGVCIVFEAPARSEFLHPKAWNAEHIRSQRAIAEVRADL